MNRHILTNYGVIKSFHNSGQSIIDALIPLVEYGIAQIEKQGKDHYDKVSLNQIIFEETGVKIPELALTNLLKKLEKVSAIRLMDHNQFFQIAEEKKLNVASYNEKLEASERRLNKFVYEYKKYTNDNRDDEEIKEFLGDFIKNQSLRYINDSDDKVLLSVNAEKLFQFLQHI